MTKTTFKIEGIKELEESLRFLGKATGRAALRRVLHAAAEPLVAAAKANAPFDEDGSYKVHLRDTIQSSNRAVNSDAGRAAYGKAMAGGASRGEAVAAMKAARSAADAPFAEIYVGPTSRHPRAITQEFGTWFHAPTFYMRDAWYSTKDGIARAIGDMIWGEISKAVERKSRRLARAAAKSAG